MASDDFSDMHSEIIKAMQQFEGTIKYWTAGLKSYLRDMRVYLEHKDLESALNVLWLIENTILTEMEQTIKRGGKQIG